MSDDEQTRAKIPTDMQVVHEFIAEAEAMRSILEDQDPECASALRRQGNTDAREALASRLAYVRVQRTEMLRAAAEELAQGMADLGRKMADGINKAFASTQAKADGKEDERG